MQFDFGKNWVAFSSNALTPQKVAQAREHFRELFRGIPLANRTFLDIGFGQGLALLLALESGARITGNDVNPKCRDAFEKTRALFPVPGEVRFVLGSVLEQKTLKDLQGPALQPQFDVVHSWGVLHHTGNMKLGIHNAAALVRPGGYLVLAIYNRHWTSCAWRGIKWFYNRSPRFMRAVMIGCLLPLIAAAKFLVTGANPFRQLRGMSFYYDVIDWVGGYPYEYAATAELSRMVAGLGFETIRTIPAGVPTGCNQFVFRKSAL